MTGHQGRRKGCRFSDNPTPQNSYTIYYCCAVLRGRRVNGGFLLRRVVADGVTGWSCCLPDRRANREGTRTKTANPTQRIASDRHQPAAPRDPIEKRANTGAPNSRRLCQSRVCGSVICGFCLITGYL